MRVLEKIGLIMFLIGCFGLINNNWAEQVFVTFFISCIASLGGAMYILCNNKEDIESV